MTSEDAWSFDVQTDGQSKRRGTLNSVASHNTAYWEHDSDAGSENSFEDHAFETLKKTNSKGLVNDTMHQARKLFMIDQLRKPSVDKTKFGTVSQSRNIRKNTKVPKGSTDSKEPKISLTETSLKNLSKGQHFEHKTSQTKASNSEVIRRSKPKKQTKTPKKITSSSKSVKTVSSRSIQQQQQQQQAPGVEQSSKQNQMTQTQTQTDVQVQQTIENSTENVSKKLLAKNERGVISATATRSKRLGPRGAELAETASRMRHSIRLKDLDLTGVTKTVTEVQTSGTPIVRQKRSSLRKSKRKTFNVNQLQSDLDGIASNLTGEDLLKVKHMGTKGFWSLSQILSNNEVKLSNYFILYSMSELCRIVNEMHINSNPHGSISAESILFDRNVSVFLQKPKTVHVRGAFSIKRMQGDILHIGIVLIELLTSKRIGTTFCNKVFRVQELEAVLGAQGVKKHHIDFEKLDKEVEVEVKKELSDFAKLWPEIVDLCVKCVRSNKDLRPTAEDAFAVIFKHLDKLKSEAKSEESEELLKTLKDFLGNKKLMAHLKRGPRLVDFTLARPLKKKHESVKTIKSEKDMTNSMLPTFQEMSISTNTDTVVEPENLGKNGENKKFNTVATGYVTDDSFYVEDTENDNADLKSEFGNDVDSLSGFESELDNNDNMSATAEVELKQQLKTKNKKENVKEVDKTTSGRKKSKNRNAFSKLKAFLRSQADYSNVNNTDDETQSNLETATTTRNPKPRPKLSIADYSTLNEAGNNNTETETSNKFQARNRRRSLDEEYIRKQRSIQADVRISTQINSDDLTEFRNDMEAKKEAAKLRKRFEPEKVGIKFDYQKRVSIDLALAIVKRADKLLRKEPNMLTLSGPVTIVGDIHGQYFDLRTMMNMAGTPGPNQTYLFLGDYVDRGNFSCEVLLYLLALKVRYPSFIWLLRGNHESRATSGYFGFKEECEAKYGTKLFTRTCELFQAMPIAALLQTNAGNFFCVHGGISPNVTNISQFTEFDRFTEPQMYGFLCDVLWADPITNEDNEESGNNSSFEDDEDEFEGVIDSNEKDKFESVIHKQSLGEYFPNPLRGCSYRFGLAALDRFLKDNNLVSVIRAHQVQQEGYCYHYQELKLKYFDNNNNNKGKKSIQESEKYDQICPPIVTIFSAPNYCGRYGNKGAYLNIYSKPAEALDFNDGESFNGSINLNLLDNSEAYEQAMATITSNNSIPVYKYKPLELMDPVQFDATEEPPVLKFENEKERTSLNIEQTCPYMPTTFDSFISKALGLGQSNALQVLANDALNVYQTALQKAQDMSKNNNKAPEVPPRKKEKENNKRNSINKSKKVKRTKSYHEDDPSTWTKLADRIKEYEQNTAKIYHEAQKSDRFNELNPLLLQQKREQAEEKIKKLDLDKNSATIKAKDFIQVKTSEEVIDEEEKKRRASYRLSRLQEEKVIKFEKKELLALQALFLLIDRKDSGRIDVDDLLSWTEDEGGFVTKEHAQMALEIVDFDKDGFIGFEDYLVFAAAAKKIWLAEEYARIITAGVEKEQQQ